ncbi:MAG: translational GTPase TypA, partial [Pseudomonadota bacterium]
CDPENVEPLPPLTVDEPTITMTFQVNDSPFAGTDGKFLTSHQIRERLYTEALHNVALRVEETEDPDKFRVSGRGELHLAILVETMRREGYELGISRPEVIIKEIDGITCEPYEKLVVDVEERHQGPVMERLGERKGRLENMIPDGKGRVRLDYEIPSRGLIGWQTDFLTVTSGSGLTYHSFERYGPIRANVIRSRTNGVLVSKYTGKAVAYALFNLQDRGQLFVEHGTAVYEGMIIGINARANDLVVNPAKGKHLTNMRAAGSDENILLTPAKHLTLEQAFGFINDDELIEVTPKFIRLRKKISNSEERKRGSR